LRHCFLNRRKLLRSAIRPLASHPLHAELCRWLAELFDRGRDERTLRAEELTDGDWQSLELLLRAKGV
jgi:16S rRNA A1518/A1519 N6-dimethyltransferase RsmA/KsgA/DIM1 with predicted DNA glycosylase/AP lyase activity